jgi:hypothetical protein
MQGLAVLVGLAAMGYGLRSAGIAGALTGLVTAVGSMSGLAIASAESGARTAAAGSTRRAQRVGGVLAACGCVLGACVGGWSSGSAWAVAGYATGSAASLVLGALSRKEADDRDDRAEEHSRTGDTT